MKKTWLFIPGLLIPLLLVFSAMGASELPDVNVDDLAQAGMTEIEVVEPQEDRFQFPVRYFRVAEGLNEQDAKRDCEDCADLVAVYIGRATNPPAWFINNTHPIRRVGGRIQVRRYISNQKAVIIVTAPQQSAAVELSNLLLNKLGSP